MPYYLAPYILVKGPSGTNRCAPKRFDEFGSWNAIDLRPNGGATLDGGGLNACLLWLPSTVIDAELDLISLDKLDTVGALVKTQLIAKLGLVKIDMSQFDQVIAEILLAPPTGKWNPIQDSFVNGRHEVYLGPPGDNLLWSQPVIAGGVTITESFNKADNGLGPDLTWTNPITGSSLQVDGNAAIGNNDGQYGEARADSDLGTANHYIQPTLGTIVLTTWFVACLWRKDSTATVTFYRWANFGDAGGWELAKFVSGTETVLDSSYTTDPTSGQNFKGQADGSTIKAFHPAATERASVTDTAIPGNLRIGIGSLSSAASTIKAPIDFLEAADLAAAGAKNYYTGGYANAQRLTRGLGFVKGRR